MSEAPASLRARFERALDENPDIQKAVAALAAAEEPYQTARTAREGFWMKDPEYREMRDAVAEIEKDLRTLNVKTKEGARPGTGEEAAAP